MKLPPCLGKEKETEQSKGFPTTCQKGKARDSPEMSAVGKFAPKSVLTSEGAT